MGITVSYRGSLDDLDNWEEPPDSEDDEAWRESLDPPGPEGNLDDDLDDDLAGRRGHPLQRRAANLLARLHALFGSAPAAAGGHLDVLLQGAGEMLGELAQALGGFSRFSADEDAAAPIPKFDVDCFSGLAVVQLKRALRGAAFALGALAPLRAGGTIDQVTFDELRDTVQSLQTDICAELASLRQRRKGES